MAVTAISFNACSKDDDGRETGTDDNSIIEFEDPNFLKALLSQTIDMNGNPRIIDINGDHQISKKEAGIALYLGVSSSNISCMEEIGYFTALEFLICHRNQLTSLNLSKNTALEHLSCYDNQLTILDVSKCKQLVHLSCSGNNLKSVIVSQYHLEELKPSLEQIVEQYGDIITYR